MLEETSQEFRTNFLLAITKQMIIQSTPSDVWKLQAELEEEQPELLINKEPFKKSILHKRLTLPIQRPPLTISSKPLPPRLQYIQPAPSQTPIELDLGKINSLIQDPAVQSIECNGSGTEITVKTPSPKKTKIILNKEEINNIINKFSQAAKIPLEEGVFKVAIGKLVLTAIVSGVVGSKFIIKKMKYNWRTQR